MQSVIALICTF